VSDSRGYRIAKVGAGERPGFQALTFPAYRRLLGLFHPATDTVAVGARAGAEPVGLALAGHEDGDEATEVLSLYVHPEHRGRGLGARLLAALGDELAAMGVRAARLSYVSGSATAPAFERVLAACGWSDPVGHMLRCRCGPRILQAPWLHRRRLSAACEVVAWHDVSDAERADVDARQAASPWIPDDLVPWPYEAGCARLNSIALRYHGEIVGWVLTHVIAPKVYRYTCSFVRADLARRLYLVPLYLEAISRQHAAEGDDSVGIWTVPLHHAAMVTFCRRRMGPWLLSMDETRTSERRWPGP